MERNKKIRFYEDLQYLALVFGLVAQAVLGKEYFLGQGLYLFGYSISAFRTIVLDRPKADKVMEFSNLGLTIGLFILGFFIFWRTLKKIKKF